MKLDSRLVVFGLCSILLLSSSAAFAQMSGTSCSEIDMALHHCGDQQKKKKEADKEKKPSQYPNATRKEPKIDISADDNKVLAEGFDAANSGDNTKAQEDLQKLVDSSHSNYVKAMALIGLAQVKYNGGDTKGAITLQKQAIDLDAMPNDNQFQSLYGLAQMYIADEQYAQALQTLDQWMKQGGKETAEAYALKGNALYRMEKYPEAVTAIQKAKSLTDKPPESWDQILMASYFAMDKYDEAGKLAEQALAKDPNNSKLLMNVVAIYVNAKQNDKALALLERARANGQLGDETAYVNMAKLYDNIGQSSSDPKPDAAKAAQVLEEGMAKGVVQQDYDNYKLLGDSYAIAGDYPKAIDAYDKAAPLSKDGEVDFLRGQLLEQVGHHAKAKVALEQAISKGVKRKGAAYLLLGNADLGLKDSAGAKAAYLQAAKDPETKAAAQRSLKGFRRK